MQSQLAAALLGHNINAISPTHVDDDNFHEEDIEESEEFDEETEGDNGKQQSRPVFGREPYNKSITLQMLLSAGILEPGPGAMSIEYLGQKFTGDLLSDGKIRSQETDTIFASPSAWAVACKRFINPDKKSGCGWASVKYKGKKLDAYKNVWYRKKKEDEKLEKIEEIEKESINLNQLLKSNISTTTTMISKMMYQRIVVKHNTVANRTLTHDANTMIECVPFSNLGKIQPFLVSLHTNAALLMDFHCHLTKSEVSGYLAGHWDVNSHNLQVTHAFPCRNTKADRANAPQVEAEIQKAIERGKLTLVGWYHSHPFAAAAPTLRDVDAQLDYQIKMKGVSDNSYTPCIGVIISPYNYENTSLESGIIAYWVIPPPEAKPNEYGRPMLMSYSVIQDSVLSSQIKDETIKCVDYYKKESDFINFNETYIGNTLYIEKLKATLISKFPRDESETAIWKFVRETLDCSAIEKDTLLSIPNVSKPSQLLSNFAPPTSVNSNLMLQADISNLLYNTGKFPSASSLLGLPDPMAHSTLAANNMFLSSNLFKMQELLKPLSSSSPIMPSKSSKNEQKSQSSPLKIPTDIKGSKTSTDLSANFLNSKNKMEFLAPDFNISKISKDFSIDYLSELTKSKEYFAEINKPAEFSVPILNTKHSSTVTSNPTDYTLNLSKCNFDTSDTNEQATKMSQMDDYSNTLDLSVSKSTAVEESNGVSPNLTHNSVNSVETDPNNTDVLMGEAPLNLADG